MVSASAGSRGVNEERREGSCLRRPPGYQEEEDLSSGQKRGYKGARTLALGRWRRHRCGAALAR